MYPSAAGCADVDYAAMGTYKVRSISQIRSPLDLDRYHSVWDQTANICTDSRTGIVQDEQQRSL